MTCFSMLYQHQYLPLPVYEVPAIHVNTTKSTHTFTSVMGQIMILILISYIISEYSDEHAGMHSLTRAFIANVGSRQYVGF